MKDEGEKIVKNIYEIYTNCLWSRNRKHFATLSLQAKPRTAAEAAQEQREKAAQYSAKT